MNKRLKVYQMTPERVAEETFTKISSSPYQRRESKKKKPKQRGKSSELIEHYHMLTPLYAGRPLTLLFDVSEDERAVNVADHCFTYKLTEGYSMYTSLRHALQSAGLKQTTAFSFNIIFTTVPKPDFLISLKSHQKVNHFPGSWQLGRKDNLWKNIDKFKRKHKKQFDICPKTFVLPDHFTQFNIERKEHPGQLWIMKPNGLSCGRGIRIVSNKSRCDNRNGYVVSRYIMNPHLINGYKYDLRLYVAVTSFDPLRVYIYEEGLVRFATEPFVADKKKIKRRYMHLTNFSVNKRSPNFVSPEEDEGASKWAFSAYLSYLQGLGVNTEGLMREIESTIIKSLISVEPIIANKLGGYNKNCFELYGYDIILDCNLKSWLLEVNISPSLSCSSPLDKRIKTQLMGDLLTLVGLSHISRKHSFMCRSASDIMDVSELGAYKLNNDDLEVLVGAYEERHRARNFKVIFPVKESIGHFSGLFQSHRYYNLLLWKFITSPDNVLNLYLNAN